MSAITSIVARVNFSSTFTSIRDTLYCSLMFHIHPCTTSIINGFGIKTWEFGY